MWLYSTQVLLEVSQAYLLVKYTALYNIVTVYP